MTNREPTPADAVLVAIDISKLRNDVLIELPGSVRRKRLTVLNTKTEHDRFVGLLGELARPVIAGFEATGNYHRPLAHRLLEAGFELRLVSSVALARTREALHNGWDKNDPKDAQVILHMLRIGATQTYCDPIRAGGLFHRPTVGTRQPGHCDVPHDACRGTQLDPTARRHRGPGARPSQRER
jgi:transposase